MGQFSKLSITMTLTLYKLDLSPPVRAVQMTIEALGISEVEYIDVNMFEGAHLTEEFKKMNPQHTIPLLKDGDFYIWDSHAIAAYLVTKYGSDDSLYPSNPQKRAVIDQKLHFDSGILFPVIRATAGPILFDGVTSLHPENLAKIKDGYEFTEKFLTSTWLAGDQLTLADICCVSTISTMNEVLPIDATVYPKLSAWLNRCSQEEFIKKVNEPGLEQLRGLLKLKLGL